MNQLIAFCTTLLLIAAAHAADVQDAPVPEPNYLGISIFLLLFIGGSAWFIWSIMHKDKKNKQNKTGPAR